MILYLSSISIIIHSHDVVIFIKYSNSIYFMEVGIIDIHIIVVFSEFGIGVCFYPDVRAFELNLFIYVVDFRYGKVNCFTDDSYIRVIEFNR